MSEGRDFLPPDVKALVEADRHRFAIPEDARARLASKLGSAGPTFGHGSAGSAASGASGASGALLGTVGAKVLVVLCLAGVGAGVVATHSRPASRPASVVAPPEPRVVVASSPLPLPPVNAAPEGVQPAAPVVPPPVLVHTAAAARPHVETVSAELAEERRLLDAARASIVTGNPEEALPALAAHASRFPDGALTEERLALQIRALSRLGRTDEARELLAILARRYPHSFVLKGATDDVGPLP